MKLPKINLSPTLDFVRKIGAFFVPAGRVIKKIVIVVWNWLRVFFGNPKAIKTIVWTLVALSIMETVFAVLIYGFKKEDKITRFVATVIPYPAVIVNQDTITYHQYLKEKDYIHHFYSATGQTDVDLAAVDKEIVDQLIENRLIANQARLNRIKVKKNDVNATMDSIIGQNGGEEQVQKILTDLYGLNLNQFKNLVKIQLLREKINSDLIAKITARHILVSVDQGATEEKIAEAKTKIDNIRTEIDGGLDFGEAAKKYSEDTGSAEAGGLLDAFAMGEMVQQFSETAFDTEIGQISDPVRTDFGWHIIKVEARTGSVAMSFNDWIESVRKNSFVLQLLK